VNDRARRSLLIVGAGGFAREAAQAVLAMNVADPASYRLLGHLDDNPKLHGKLVDGVPVVGPVDCIADHPDAHVVVATGRPTDYFSRHRLVARLGLSQDRYATVVHPTASIADSCVVGPGSILLAGVTATAAVAVGRHVAVMPGVVLTHDDVIEDFATLAAGVLVGGGVSVRTGAYVGSGARVRENLAIGEWSLVGMGSLVTRSLPDHEVWFGSPARPQGKVVVPDDVLGVLDDNHGLGQEGHHQ
jgi:sugar O-acyltransferase (sialic acid O-acetyltransferase NeuD family)